MKNRMLIGIALAVWLVPNALAQEKTVLDDFIGSWRGTGTLFGQPADFEMVWERQLKDRFLHLSFRNRFIEAEASYYPTESGIYRGTWIDSRGVELPLSAGRGGFCLQLQLGIRGDRAGAHELPPAGLRSDGSDG